MEQEGGMQRLNRLFCELIVNHFHDTDQDFTGVMSQYQMLAGSLSSDDNASMVNDMSDAALRTALMAGVTPDVSDGELRVDELEDELMKLVPADDAIANVEGKKKAGETIERSRNDITYTPTKAFAELKPFHTGGTPSKSAKKSRTGLRCSYGPRSATPKRRRNDTRSNGGK